MGQKESLRAGVQDFKGDGIPETVVYNKAGRPWIINGSKLKASDYPIRNAFFREFPTPESRIGVNMKNQIQDKAYDIKEDRLNPWRKHINTSEFGRRLEETGYKMPTKPKKKLSVFNIFCKLIAPQVTEYYESEAGYPITLLGGNCGPDCIQILKKIISPITMYRMLFMKMVERSYFFPLLASGIPRFQNMSYEQFKKTIKRNDESFSSIR